jgi:hypothetical protein
MRKKHTLALALNKETIRTLNLDDVRGGAGQRTDETGCTVIGCPSRGGNCPPPPPPRSQATEHTGCSVLVCCR